MTGHGNDLNLQKKPRHFEGLKWSELSRILDLRIYEFSTKLNVLVLYINSTIN